MSSTRRSFCLSGPSVHFDPRVQAVRGDLADVALAGTLFAPHYAEPVARICLSDAPMLDKPGGKQISELLTGECFAMLDAAGGWAWGWSVHDHYVGYVLVDQLVVSDVAPTSVPAGDPAALAETFLNTPYVWGGRGGSGIDCSGLVQRAFAAKGVAAPRDSDMQQVALGRTLGAQEALQRADLVFFPGHVAMLTDAETLIHATQHYGKTVKEPLADVIARFAVEHADPILARKRID